MMTSCLSRRNPTRKTYYYSNQRITTRRANKYETYRIYNRNKVNMFIFNNTVHTRDMDACFTCDISSLCADERIAMSRGSRPWWT